MSKKRSEMPMPQAKAEAQPATRKMLSLVRDELRSEIRGLEQKMDSRFEHLESRFTQIESCFTQMDARGARMELLLEEQNANNRIVLEGLQALWQRQERLEKRVDDRLR